MKVLYLIAISCVLGIAAQRRLPGPDSSEQQLTSPKTVNRSRGRARYSVTPEYEEISPSHEAEVQRTRKTDTYRKPELAKATEKRPVSRPLKAAFPKTKPYEVKEVVDDIPETRKTVKKPRVITESSFNAENVPAGIHETDKVSSTSSSPVSPSFPEGVSEEGATLRSTASNNNVSTTTEKSITRSETEATLKLTNIGKTETRPSNVKTSEIRRLPNARTNSRLKKLEPSTTVASRSKTRTRKQEKTSRPVSSLHDARPNVRASTRRRVQTMEESNHEVVRTRGPSVFTAVGTHELPSRSRTGRKVSVTDEPWTEISRSTTTTNSPIKRKYNVNQRRVNVHRGGSRSETMLESVTTTTTKTTDSRKSNSRRGGRRMESINVKPALNKTRKTPTTTTTQKNIIPIPLQNEKQMKSRLRSRSFLTFNEQQLEVLPLFESEPKIVSRNYKQAVPISKSNLGQYRYLNSADDILTRQTKENRDDKAKSNVNVSKEENLSTGRKTEKSFRNSQHLTKDKNKTDEHLNSNQIGSRYRQTIKVDKPKVSFREEVRRVTQRLYSSEKEKDIPDTTEDVSESDNYPSAFKAKVQARKNKKEKEEKASVLARNSTTPRMNHSKPIGNLPTRPSFIPKKLKTPVSQHSTTTSDSLLKSSPRKFHARFKSTHELKEDSKTRPSPTPAYKSISYSPKAPKGIYSSKKFSKKSVGNLVEHTETPALPKFSLVTSGLSTKVPLTGQKDKKPNRFSSRYRTDIFPPLVTHRTSTSGPLYIPTVPTVTPSTSVNLGMDVISFDEPIANTVPSASLISEDYLSSSSPLKSIPTALGFANRATEKPASIIERIINSITSISTTTSPNTTTKASTFESLTKSSAILSLVPKKVNDNLTTIHPSVQPTSQTLNSYIHKTTEKPTTIIEQILDSLSALRADTVEQSSTIETIKVGSNTIDTSSNISRPETTFKAVETTTPMLTPTSAPVLPLFIDSLTVSASTASSSSTISSTTLDNDISSTSLPKAEISTSTLTPPSVSTSTPLYTQSTQTTLDPANILEELGSDQILPKRTIDKLLALLRLATTSQAVPTKLVIVTPKPTTFLTSDTELTTEQNITPPPTTNTIPSETTTDILFTSTMKDLSREVNSIVNPLSPNDPTISSRILEMIGKISEIMALTQLNSTLPSNVNSSTDNPDTVTKGNYLSTTLLTNSIPSKSTTTATTTEKSVSTTTFNNVPPVEGRSQTTMTDSLLVTTMNTLMATSTSSNQEVTTQLLEKTPGTTTSALTTTKTVTTTESLGVTSTLATLSSFKVSPNGITIYSANNVASTFVPEEIDITTTSIGARSFAETNEAITMLPTTTTTTTTPIPTDLTTTTVSSSVIPSSVNVETTTQFVSSNTTDTNSATLTVTPSVISTSVNAINTTIDTTTQDISSNTIDTNSATDKQPSINQTLSVKLVNSLSININTAENTSNVGSKPMMEITKMEFDKLMQIDPSALQNNISNKPVVRDKDYFIFAVLPNNTVLRKRPSMYPTKETPFLIYGILPNNTLVQKFPNGTVVPMEPVIQVVGFDTRDNPPPVAEPIYNQVTRKEENQHESNKLSMDGIAPNTISTDEANALSINGDSNNVSNSLPTLIEMFKGQTVEEFKNIVNQTSLSTPNIQTLEINPNVQSRPNEDSVQSNTTSSATTLSQTPIPLTVTASINDFSASTTKMMAPSSVTTTKASLPNSPLITTMLPTTLPPKVSSTTASIITSPSLSVSTTETSIPTTTLLKSFITVFPVYYNTLSQTDLPATTETSPTTTETSPSTTETSPSTTPSKFVTTTSTAPFTSPLNLSPNFLSTTISQTNSPSTTEASPTTTGPPFVTTTPRAPISPIGLSPNPLSVDITINNDILSRSDSTTPIPSITLLDLLSRGATATTPEPIVTTPLAATVLSTTIASLKDLNLKQRTLTEQQKQDLAILEALEKEQEAILQQLAFLTGLNFGAPSPNKGGENLANRVIAMATRKINDTKNNSADSKMPTSFNLLEALSPKDSKQSRSVAPAPNVEKLIKQVDTNGLNSVTAPGPIVSSTYGKTDEALLASLLKEYGVGPTTPKVLSAAFSKPVRSTTPIPKPTTTKRITTTAAPNRLMQSLNWLLNALAPRPTIKRQPVKANPKPKQIEKENLNRQPTEIVPVIVMPDQSGAESKTQTNVVVDHKQIGDLIKQLEEIRKNPKKAKDLDVDVLKALQSIDRPTTRWTNKVEVTSIKSIKPIVTNPGQPTVTNALYATSSNTVLEELRPIPKSKVSIPIINSKKVPSIAASIQTTTKGPTIPPVKLNPVPGIPDENPRIRGQLVNYAITVTKAISTFLGSALQGATNSFQSIIRSGLRA